MNLNDNPERLKEEEQRVLADFISELDEEDENLNEKIREKIEEAKNISIRDNPDEYLSLLLAKEGIKDTAENRQKLLQARDELYASRLLLSVEDDEKGVEEFKVGLHEFVYKGKIFVATWKMPVFRHYMLDNSSVEYQGVVKNKYGKEYKTKFRLIVKDQVKLRFTHVQKAINLYPGEIDEETLEEVRNTGFFSKEFIEDVLISFNPDDYDPDSAYKLISDEFLQELLERRTTPEFKNIVFSIQKKQGEIIQVTYNKNMIVQGCAGSGKSMIMLHRLPILLYDNPDSLPRTDLFIISPSQMYIQMAENMRHQLEISDLRMGTIEQYYDLCIAKYPGHKAGEYGKIRYTSRLQSEDEKYIYSDKCISDIKSYIESLIKETDFSLDKAYERLNISENDIRSSDMAKSYSGVISNRLFNVQRVLKENNTAIIRYYTAIRNTIESLNELRTNLKFRKDRVLREIDKSMSKLEQQIVQAQTELDGLDPVKNAVAVERRNKLIESNRSLILKMQEEKKAVEGDKVHFELLADAEKKIETLIGTFGELDKEFDNNTVEQIYKAIEKIGQVVGGYYTLSWDLSRIEDKYGNYLDPINTYLTNSNECVMELQGISDTYLDLKYYIEIRLVRDALSDLNSRAVIRTYDYIMAKVGIKRGEKGGMRALTCSPYLYLQILYLFQGSPNGRKESLLAIDEAQGVASEEIRLLKNINDGKVVFNLYGDIYQHIEGTKGVEKWEEYSQIIDYDIYEMQENYRNASQITDYCNKKFLMNMNAINTPGKGVHEVHGADHFRTMIRSLLLNSSGDGLSAILVGSDAEARYLMGEFAEYKQKFHDMTDEDFSIHRTRWNIIHIDDAKGLEFTSVIVLAGRMSRNQRYIAYTRALDDLYVYEEEIDVKGYERKPRIEKDDDSISDKVSEDVVTDIEEKSTDRSYHADINDIKDHTNSEVRSFFINKGYEVVDKRDEGGRLWVIGNKEEIREIVEEARSRFNISGKYTSSKESRNRPGWCTKTNK